MLHFRAMELMTVSPGEDRRRREARRPVREIDHPFVPDETAGKEGAHAAEALLPEEIEPAAGSVIQDLQEVKQLAGGGIPVVRPLLAGPVRGDVAQPGVHGLHGLAQGLVEPRLVLFHQQESERHVRHAPGRPVVQQLHFLAEPPPPVCIPFVPVEIGIQDIPLHGPLHGRGNRRVNLVELPVEEIVNQRDKGARAARCEVDELLAGVRKRPLGLLPRLVGGQHPGGLLRHKPGAVGQMAGEPALPLGQFRQQQRDHRPPVPALDPFHRLPVALPLVSQVGGGGDMGPGMLQGLFSPADIDFRRIPEQRRPAVAVGIGGEGHPVGTRDKRCGDTGGFILGCQQVPAGLPRSGKERKRQQQEKEGQSSHGGISHCFPQT